MRPFSVILFCSNLPFPGGAVPGAGSPGPPWRGGTKGERLWVVLFWSLIHETNLFWVVTTP